MDGYRPVCQPLRRRIEAPTVTTLVHAQRLVGLPDDASGEGWIEIDGDRILGAGRGAPSRTPDLELDEGILAPGLIDAQINGAFSVDFADADADEVRDVA